MKITAFLFCLCFFVPQGFASEGGGVKNGGSAVACPGYPVMLAETAFAMRTTALIPIEDRTKFMDAVLAKIKNDTFRNLLLMQWTKYGDSEFWPEGDLRQTEVYYFDGPMVMEKYDSLGRIPARAPGSYECNEPLYEPENCCARLLVSYFGPLSPTPYKLENHYRQLSRIEKNALEVHEAVYRMAWELAKLPAPLLVPMIQQSEDEHKREYLSLKGAVGEMPSTHVMTLVTKLIRESEDPASVDFELRVFWNWTSILRTSSLQ